MPVFKGIIFDRIEGVPADRGKPARKGEEQEMFRAPFQAPSSCRGGEKCYPEEGCSDTQTAAGLHFCSSQ